MRRTRRLLLALIAVLIVAVSVIYTLQKQTQARHAPAPPKSLPRSVGATASEGWVWENTTVGKPSVRVRARDFLHNAQTNHLDLTGVELQLFHKDGKAFDRVQSEKADFDLTAGLLYSDGDVEITMDVPVGAGPAAAAAGKLMKIRTSGVRFDNKTGKASTERKAVFTFDRGQGESVGAQYDPATRELHMRSDVRLQWHGSNPAAPPMHVEAGSLVYKETANEVWLTPWSRFRRQTLTMDGGNAVVKLEEGAIRTVDAIAARGVDRRPARTLEYSADTMNLRFGPGHVVEHVTGSRNARLLSTATTSKTSVQSDQIDLEFVKKDEESALTRARASGGAVVESQPVLRAGVPPPDTRVLKSQAVLLHMRDGGEEIDRVEADSPGHIDFLPNRPDSRKRTVDGNMMTLHYGTANQIRTFTATDVTTRTEPLPTKGRKPGAPAVTSSKGMTAHFDEKSGLMTLLEQWDQFRYQEGERKARADRAEFRQPVEQILLTGTARVEDTSGSTDADRITLNQKSGDFEAQGNVASMRRPEPKKDVKGGMLAADAPVQAKALKMTTTGDNSLIVYEGNALLWQEADRIQADMIRIDRKTNRLAARGNVQTRLLEKATADPKTGKKREPGFTIVRAPEFDYDDKTRLAHYRGGATLTQGATVVTAQEIRAWLVAGGTSSTLEKAFADGNVKIVQTAADRTRTGTAEHGEYYPGENKVLLSGGKPVFQDSLKGTTTGRRITFFAAEDRIEVEGEAQQPVETRILKRKKPGS